METLSDDPFPLTKEVFNKGFDHRYEVLDGNRHNEKWQQEICKDLALYDRRGWESQLKSTNHAKQGLFELWDTDSNNTLSKGELEAVEDLFY